MSIITWKKNPWITAAKNVMFLPFLKFEYFFVYYVTCMNFKIKLIILQNDAVIKTFSSTCKQIENSSQNHLSVQTHAICCNFSLTETLRTLHVMLHFEYICTLTL